MRRQGGDLVPSVLLGARDSFETKSVEQRMAELRASFNDRNSTRYECVRAYLAQLLSNRFLSHSRPTRFRVRRSSRDSMSH